jgi:hypothetical protein
MRRVATITVSIGFLIGIIGSIGYWVFFSETPKSSIKSVVPTAAVVSKVSDPSDSSQTAMEMTRTQDSSLSQKKLERNHDHENWLLVALAMMGVATSISVGISFYLYRWRRILLGNPHMIVPEEWGKHLTNLRKHIEKLTNSFSLGVSELNRETSENSDRVSNMVETFMIFQKALDEREAEIRRLKKGYDSAVFRKYLYRFIRIDQTIDTFIHEGSSSLENLHQIKRLMEDAFDECGVEIFEPQVGTDYRTADGVADKPKTDKSENPDDAFKISELLEPGYRLRGGEVYEIIVPAKVKIYTV